MQSKESVTFGGNPFTIDFWFYVSTATEQWGSISKITNNGNNGLIEFLKIQRNASDGSCYVKIYNSAGQSIITYSYQDDYSTFDLNQQMHFELCYLNSQAYFFTNGRLRAVKSGVVERLARNIFLGADKLIGTISEFRILDGVCLHTANFSPPTAPYDLTDETVTLLHF